MLSMNIASEGSTPNILHTRHFVNYADF
uniref:Uncharacterized protein n=1 Tax=Anguilla anguilla TaxID=7936 RepID=A0A0E9TGI9_ANGAN